MHVKNFENVQVMWEPTEDSGKLIKEFSQHISKKYNIKINDYWDLHRWSVENFRTFWSEIWSMFKIVCSQQYKEVLPMDAQIEDVHLWFAGARLNFAENLLRYRDDHVALIVAGEDRETEKITYSEVYQEACRYGAALRKFGLKKGDRAVCFMSNRKEPIYAMLAASAIGAIWSGALPLLGSQAALNRFKQSEPKIMFAVDRFQNDNEEKEMLQKVKEIAEGLPSLEKVVIVPSKPESRLKNISGIRNSCFLDEFLASGLNEDGSVPDLEFEQLPFDHPVFISYTSGTTGTPKALIHGSGGLMSIIRDFYLHSDATRDNVWLSMSPCGWASWNMFCTMLSLGITIVIFEGVPFYLSKTYLWDMVDEFKLSNLLLTPSTLDELEKKGYLPTEKHQLTSLRVIISGTSVVKPQNYDFVYKKLKTNVIFGSAYGSTELMGACMMLEQTLPLYRGELSCASLGMDICCYNEEGKPVVGELGELVIRTPTPSLPLGLWGEKDRSKFVETYFSKFPGVFAPGDLCTINPVTKGFIIHGRSDDTLKPKGTRFGSSEIYNIVDTFPEILDSICVSQYNKHRDERAVLFLKMRNGHQFTPDLIQRIRKTIERELSKDHVPDVILETPDIPHNMNGKKMEIIVKKIINNMPYNPETVINSECLENFYNVPELQDF